MNKECFLKSNTEIGNRIFGEKYCIFKSIKKTTLLYLPKALSLFSLMTAFLTATYLSIKDYFWGPTGPHLKQHLNMGNNTNSMILNLISI